MDMDSQGSKAVIAIDQVGVSYRASLIHKATQRSPTTSEGLPIGFYRADLLPSEPLPDDSQGMQELQALKVAYVELGYDQGYPTLPSGEPFWHKFDHEPGLAFSMFQAFLEQNESGVRELSALASTPEFLRVLQAQCGEEFTKYQALKLVNEYATVYYWRTRAKAYDLFREAAYRSVRIRRAMNAEDYHYTTAERLLRKVVEYLDTPEFIERLNPKVALDALGKLVTIQRISAGLPASGPLTQKESPEATSFELILRRLGLQQSQVREAAGGLGDARQKSGMLDNILKDQDSARQMQELIIRVTTAITPEPPKPRGRTYEGVSTGPESEGEAPEVSDADLTEDLRFHNLGG
jgi:hypothetical protein